MKAKAVKTLDDIKVDMSELYDQVRQGQIELKTASELANIAGKFLKAEQLQLAREIFLDGRAHSALQQLLANDRKARLTTRQ